MTFFKVFVIIAAIIFAGIAGGSLVAGTYKVGDRFELFRDLLLVLVALGSLMGLALYHLVRESVRDEVTKSFRVEISRERGRNLISVGLEFYQSDPPDLKRAIARTRQALKEEGLDEPNVIMAKNNLAYYLAVKFTQERVEQHAAEALKLAEEVYKRYSPVDELYDYPEWVETWVFVKTSTTEKVQEMQTLVNKVEEFLRRDDLKSKHELLRQHLITLQQKIGDKTGT